MHAAPIGVGIIGANPDIGWASQTHLPIVDASPDFNLAAVATTRKESAAAAAERYGAARSYTDPRALIDDPDVSLVTISVKCPDHKDLLQLALDSDKHVYCEWPLASSTADAEAIAVRAREVSAHKVIGLQAMAAPAIRHAAELIAKGFIGTPESVVIRYVVATGKKERSARHSYLFDPASGAGVLGIHTGHALSGVLLALGAPTRVSALMYTRNPRLRIVETGEEFETAEPDHITMTGLIDGGGGADDAAAHGVLLLAEVHYTHQRDPFSSMEILGSEAALRIATRPWPAPNHERVSLQTGDTHLFVTRNGQRSYEQIDAPSPYPEPPGSVPHQGRNVARMYSMLARDVRDGTRIAPDFDDAVRMHRVLDAIKEAASRAVDVNG